MKLTIAYLAPAEPREKQKRLTHKQKLHQMAIESLARRRHHDKIMAKKKYFKEIQELEELEKKHGIKN